MCGAARGAALNFLRFDCDLPLHALILNRRVDLCLFNSLTFGGTCEQFARSTFECYLPTGDTQGHLRIRFSPL